MNPSHRGESGEAADATASAFSAPDDLDVLVDRLAAEQATSDADDAAEMTPGTDADTEADGRPEPPYVAEEVETLLGFLDFLRATIAWKAGGLSDEQASARLVGSDTTVTGMIRHLADTERSWFREIVGGVPPEEVGYSWSDGHDASGEWALETGASLQEALTDYAAAIELSRAQLHEREPSEELHGAREVRTVRWVLVHMVEETARHAGQLDVLVELLDGRTGE